VSRPGSGKGWIVIWPIPADPDGFTACLNIASDDRFDDRKPVTISVLRRNRFDKFDSTARIGQN
jgi:hypothetical protein